MILPVRYCWNRAPLIVKDRGLPPHDRSPVIDRRSRHLPVSPFASNRTSNLNKTRVRLWIDSSFDENREVGERDVFQPFAPGAHAALEPMIGTAPSECGRGITPRAR